MAFTVAAFRKTFPEFSDTGVYSDSLILGWSAIAARFVDVRRWRNSADLGVNLYVAHEITLEAQSINAANVGGTPGNQSGPVNTKTVGSVTVGYDTAQALEKDAGHWNLTSYGKQYWRLLRMFGMGSVQL